MADEDLTKDVSGHLQEANRQAERLLARLEAGEDVPEEEMVALARFIAGQIEEARMRLEQAVGPRDRAEIRAAMKERMSPEEYEEWLRNEESMLDFREQYWKEKFLREQLREPGTE